MEKELLKNISIPVMYEVQPFEDDRFRKVKIYVMHDKLNLNGSNFNMDAIELAKSSICNIPILAFVKKSDGINDDDFAGHEMELIITSDGDIKTKYLGRPIGVIPEIGNDYHYEIREDKTYVVVYGYIWTNYANEALDILERDVEKGQSMEIKIDDGEWDYENDWYNITKYRYTGVTILGDDVMPAMVGAKVQMAEYQFSSDYFSMVEELREKLKEVFDNKGGDNELENLDTNLENNDNDNENLDSQLENNIDTNSTDLDNNDLESNSNNDNDDKPEDYELVISGLNTQIFDLNKELNELKNEYSLLEEEVIKLREYRRITESEKELGEKEQVFAEYSIALTEDEMKPVKDKINELSLNDITVNLNAIYTAKSLAEIKKTKFSNENNQDTKVDIYRRDNPKSKYAVS